jgi:hypothetical protein
MAAKSCLNHREREAVAQCHQCHKPMCAECVMDDPLGKFCSPQCLARFREFKARWKEPDTKPPFSLVGLLSGLTMLAIVLLGIAWIGHNVVGMPFFARYDYLGKWLSKPTPPTPPANAPADAPK